LMTAPSLGPRRRHKHVPVTVLVVAMISVATTWCSQGWSAVLASSSGLVTPRHVLITGGSRGVGFAVCEALTKASTGDSPITVIVASRSSESAVAASTKLREGMSAGAAVVPVELDVADTDSRAAAVEKLQELIGEHSKLTALVNNAGVALDLPWSPPAPAGGDAEIAEITLKTNFLGACALTTELINCGLLGAGSRVISVSSGGGHIAIQKVLPEIQQRFLAQEFSTNDIVKAAQDFIADAKLGGKPELEKKWGYSHCYGFSKLCLTTLTRTLAKEHPELIVHACTPGFILTDMTKGSSAAKTPEEGATIITYLVLSTDEVVQESGKFFNAEKEVLAWDDDRYAKK